MYCRGVGEKIQNALVIHFYCYVKKACIAKIAILGDCLHGKQTNCVTYINIILYSQFGFGKKQGPIECSRVMVAGGRGHK